MHFEIWSPKIQLDFKLSNLPTFHFMHRGVGQVKQHFKIWTTKIQLHENFQICQHFILQGEKGGGGEEWHFEIWSLKIQFYLKLLNLKTFYFTGWEVVKQNFEIWSPRIQLDLNLPNLPAFHFMLEWWGGGMVKWHSKIWSSRNQLHLKLPNLPTFHFRVREDRLSSTLNSEIQKYNLTA